MSLLISCNEKLLQMHDAAKPRQADDRLCFATYADCILTFEFFVSQVEFLYKMYWFPIPNVEY